MFKKFLAAALSCVLLVLSFPSFTYAGTGYPKMTAEITGVSSHKMYLEISNNTNKKIKVKGFAVDVASKKEGAFGFYGVKVNSVATKMGKTITVKPWGTKTIKFLSVNSIPTPCATPVSDRLYSILYFKTQWKGKTYTMGAYSHNTAVRKGKKWEGLSEEDDPYEIKKFWADAKGKYTRLYN